VKTEGDVKDEICKMLQKSPDVAWYTVNTTGIFKRRGYKYSVGKWFRTNPKKQNTNGMSDITGMLITGIFFAIEVKKPGKEPIEDQWEYINYVSDNGGLSGYATSVKEAEQIIRGFQINLK